MLKKSSLTSFSCIGFDAAALCCHLTIWFWYFAALFHLAKHLKPLPYEPCSRWVLTAGSLNTPFPMWLAQEEHCLMMATSRLLWVRPCCCCWFTGFSHGYMHLQLLLTRQHCPCRVTTSLWWLVSPGRGGSRAAERLTSLRLSSKRWVALCHVVNSDQQTSGLVMWWCF